MTPEEKQEFEALKKKVEELEEWKNQKTEQQISLPLDEASVQIIQDAT